MDVTFRGGARRTFGLTHEGVLWNVPGRAAARYAVGDGDELHALLNVTRPDPPPTAYRDPAVQRELVASVFAGDGWEIRAW